MTVALVANIARPISSAISTAFSADSYGALSSYGLLGGSAVVDPDAVIEALFANSEQGAWYDQSDLSTMFQDSAGTTPVTGVGQPVGLILDKSKGLVLGSELVTNGTFDSDMAWTKGAGVTITGGAAVFTNVANNQDSLYQTCMTTNKTYSFTYTVTGYVSGSVRMHNGEYTGPTRNANGTYTETIRTASANLVFKAATSGTSLSLDDISVKEIAGNHAFQATAASRPLLAATGLAEWTNYDAVDDVLNTTFPSSLGSSCTVARANVGAAPTILTAQTIGTSYADSTDNAGLIIVNRALTTQETIDLTAWLTAKGETA